MTRKFTFLLMALLALAGLKSWGQMDVVIGTGTSTTSYYPFNGLYNYSYSEMLYGADEIGVAGSINSISFNSSSATSKAIDFDLDIYMKNVNRTTHSSNSDWETVSESDKVCHATLSGYTTGWITFTLDEPFEYDGTSTLMIAFDHNTGDYSSKSFYSHTSENHKSLCKYLDGSNIDPSDPAATVGASTNFSGTRPNIKINITPTGLASHTITYVQPDNGTISGPAEAYEGQPVTLTATPDANYALGQFFVNGSPIEGNTFTMPTSDVTVTATFVPHYTLTVNDGTNTNSYVPIYGYYADGNCKSQFIIPASALGDMLGGTVSDMTFYLNSSSSISFTGTWDVYVKEVDNATLSGFVSWDDLGSAVYYGNITITNGLLSINFATPITYNGNNLLIGFNETVSGNCPSTSWLGVSQSSNTAWYSTYNGAGNPQQFLPKTTFSYVPNPNLHHITVTQPVEGGTISAPATAISGTTVTLTATPELGYEFGEWNITPSVTLIGNSFEMPASDVTITATFNALQQYDITFVGVDETLITVAAKYNNETINNAPAGTEVTLEYTLLNEGYTFINWTLNGEPLAGNTFEMPANDVEIGVVLNERPRYAVIIDGSIAHGTVTASPNENILSGKTVTLTVTPADSYVLNTLTVTDADSNPVVVTNNQFTMPESNVTVTATFSPVLTLTVNDGTATNNSVPFEGYNIDGYLTKSQFIISASDLENMAGGTITDLTFYLSGTQNKELPAASWEIYLKEVNTTEQGYEFIDYESMTKVYTGKLSIVNYQVKIHLDTPYQYNAASENPHLMVGFKQTANGSGTWATTNWHGAEDGTGIMRSRRYGSDGNASYNFLPKTTFTYSNPNLHGITLNQPEGGEISASTGAALPGTVVTLTLVQAPLGYELGAWVVKDAEDNDITVTDNTFEMPASDVTVSATFNEMVQYNITFATLEEGAIHAEYNNATITKAPAGTTVTLVVALNTGYGLDQFIVDGEALDGNTFVMPSHDVEVSATFVPALTVYDGTDANMYTAVYAFYGDTDNSAAQFVVPAEQLTAMVGGEISSIKFYVDPNNITNLTNLGGPSYAGYITEVTETTMSSFIDFGSATTVFTGHVSLSNNNSELVIDFSAPYTYNGGNLAIAFECTAKAGYTTLNYYGTTVSGGGIYRNSGTGATINNFIPKTTFLYTPVTPYTVNLHVNGVVSEEEVSSLPTPENIPAGMTFCGWTSSDIATYTTEAPSYVTKATADGEDFYAVFSYSEAEQTSGQNWVKITNPSELVDGEEIVLVYNDSYVMGQRSSFGTNYTRHAVEVVDGRIASMPSEANTFTLSESSGNWKLNYNDSEVGNTTLSYNTNDCLAYYGLWEAYECYSYDVWTAEGTSKVIFKNNYNNEYIGEDESEYAELIHSVSNANLACQAFKKDVALVTYYMTSVLTGGTVANATVKNIIVVNPITVSGRLEMNAAGLFRNENVANFVFADGAQFYYTGEESVNATFEKDITGYTGDNDNYYLIANPTDNDVVANLTDNDYDLYSFDPWGDDDGYEWINEEGEEVFVKPYSNEDGSAVAVGYLYANREDVTLEFAGVLNPAGSTDIELTYAEEGEGRDFPGFNLIGNPYACKAYVSGYSFYKMVNGELRANNARTATIAPCEGVFVEATAANQQVTVTTTAPNVGEDDINVNVTKNSRGEVIDRAVISFDGRNDMHKFMMNPANTNIRLAKNGQEYAAISCDAEGEIPVSFKAAEDDTYTITVNANNENTRYLHLIDNLTGMDVDLLANPSYTFNALTSDYAYRFKLVFSMNIDNNQSDNTNNFAFMSDGNLVINNIDGEATLQIVDVLGRVVSTEIVSGSYNKALNLKSGLYILNLNGMTQKIVVE